MARSATASSGTGTLYQPSSRARSDIVTSPGPARLYVPASPRPATARASLALYNTREEVDVFVSALAKVWKVFG